MRWRNIGRIALAIALWGAPPALAQEERAEWAGPVGRAGDRGAAVFVRALPARVGVRGRPADQTFTTEPSVHALRPPADAVLEEGDVIVSVDGKLEHDERGRPAAGLLEPGDRVRLRIRRDGGEKDVTITAAPTCDFLRHGSSPSIARPAATWRSDEAHGRELRDAVRRARRDVQGVRLGRPVPRTGASRPSRTRQSGSGLPVRLRHAWRPDSSPGSSRPTSWVSS